jgi:hypothetical protein
MKQSEQNTKLMKNLSERGNANMATVGLLKGEFQVEVTRYK